MKANELRIGNWVNAQTPEYHVESGEYCINSINLKGIGEDKKEQYLCHLLLPDRCSFIVVMDEDILPIPLTEEWLLKFGFEFSHYGEISLEGFIIEKFHDGYHYTGGEGVSFGTPITYVHQLQNLYFALTGDELKLQ